MAEVRDFHISARRAALRLKTDRTGGQVSQRRTATNEFIEGVVPINAVAFAVRTGRTPARVVLAPSGQELPFRQEGAYCHVTVPYVVTSQIVALEGV